MRVKGATRRMARQGREVVRKVIKELSRQDQYDLGIKVSNTDPGGIDEDDLEF